MLNTIKNFKENGGRIAAVLPIHYSRELLRAFNILIDIGGQDSKVIRIAPAGKVIDFAMNDKCAAGTGRFLENTALGEELGEAVLLPRYPQLLGALGAAVMVHA